MMSLVNPSGTTTEQATAFRSFVSTDNMAFTPYVEFEQVLGTEISTPAMIDILGLSKSYTAQKPVLDDISLRIMPGDIYGIIGRSGAGKSTLVRCLNCLERPSSGQIIIGGVDIVRLKAKLLRQARRQIGMVFQHFNLLSSRTVAQNVALPMEMAGLRSQWITQRVAELLALVGLTEKAQSYPAALSGGQKQRVGIARALALEPQVLLCDEATSALDPESTEQILALLKTINGRLGLTVLLISHEMQAVRDIATHVAVLERGRIVETGSTYQVFAHPKSNVTRRFVGATAAHELPQILVKRIVHTASFKANTPVLRVIQVNEQTAVPVIALLQKRFSIAASVIHGRVDYIGNQPLSVMTLLLPDAQQKLTDVRQWLQQEQIHTEVIGYVE